VLPEISQFTRVGLLKEQLIPPPVNVPVFPVMSQSVSVGLLWSKQQIPPPMLAVLPEILQSVSVGLLWSSQKTPPPLDASPPVIVNPSMTVFAPSPPLHHTTILAPSPSTIVSSAVPVALMVMALPPGLMTESPLPVYVPGATRISSPSLAASTAA